MQHTTPSCYQTRLLAATESLARAQHRAQDGRGGYAADRRAAESADAVWCRVTRCVDVVVSLPYMSLLVNARARLLALGGSSFPLPSCDQSPRERESVKADSPISQSWLSNFQTILPHVDHTTMEPATVSVEIVDASPTSTARTSNGGMWCRHDNIHSRVVVSSSTGFCVENVFASLLGTLRFSMLHSWKSGRS